MRWSPRRLRRDRVPPLTRLLETHRAAHLAAAFTPGHEAEAEFHACWIDAVEHGATADEASRHAIKRLTGLT